MLKSSAAVRTSGLRLGVWCSNPRPGEGPPATILREGDGEVLRGVKTFCSGAGGLDRALVLARDPRAAAPIAAWVDLTQPGAIEIDEHWYRGAGLRASVSHRVVFHGAPVLGLLGPPGALSAQPWFARDALRTAASWAGMADSALEGALGELAQRPRRGAIEELAAGRMLTAHHTITVWLGLAARAMDEPTPQLPAVALHGRAAIVDACRILLDEAGRACGSHPFATGEMLDPALAVIWSCFCSSIAWILDWQRLAPQRWRHVNERDDGSGLRAAIPRLCRPVGIPVEPLRALQVRGNPGRVRSRAVRGRTRAGGIDWRFQYPAGTAMPVTDDG